MDYTHVVAHLDDIGLELPEADMYIGHSAGSIIVSTQLEQPRILMGSPVQLLHNAQVRTASANLLNLMHARDPVAAPVANAKNVTVKGPWSLLRYFLPLWDHVTYWRSPRILNNVVHWFNLHVGN
jgi:hypothetical protein